MPVVAIDGARIHYRRRDPPSHLQVGSAPVVLIHGATVDGLTDWGALAPVLALRRTVIVPDLRGHGRSTSTSGSFSFRQAAADIATLITLLGFERAHVVGHSNGGNIALITLVEHPEVIGTCIVQAGNAYVSDDLREREPANFDPDAVERDDPEWRDQMIALHGGVHGRGYWRTMLAMTLREIVSGPNFSETELGAVSRPTLVIEGTDDRVNARSHHGEFIAAHIPDAELWRPEAGHRVHEQLAGTWITRVEDFWDRRGTAIGDRLWRLRQGTDGRHAVFDASAGPSAAGVVVRGVVSTAIEAAQLVEAADDFSRSEITILDAISRPGIVVTTVADVLEAPDPDAPRRSQALFGERVDLLDERPPFVRVRLLRDDYIGWMRQLQVVEGAPDATRWVRVIADFAPAFAAPAGAFVTRIPFGARVPIAKPSTEWLHVRMPERRPLWIRSSDTRPDEAHDTLEEALTRIARFVGVPYLWGGRTPFGFDCSGLSQTFHDLRGIAVPRDSDEQWATGAPFEGDRRPGDLLFFGDPSAGARPRISHVAIALDGVRFVHAWGALGAVVVSDLVRGSAICAAPLIRRLIGCRRIAGDGMRGDAMRTSEDPGSRIIADATAQPT